MNDKEKIDKVSELLEEIKILEDMYYDTSWKLLPKISFLLRDIREILEK